MEPVEGDAIPVASESEELPVADEGAGPIPAPGGEEIGVAVEVGTEVPEPAPLDGLTGPLAIGGGVGALAVLALLGWVLWSRSGGAASMPSLEPPQQDLAVDEDRPPPPPAEVPPPPPSLADRLRAVMGKSRALLQERFDQLLGSGAIDEEVYDGLEEALLSADVGMPTTTRLLDELRRVKGDGAELREVLRTRIRALLAEAEAPLGPPPDEPPWVILVVGVNGSGKTTTIGKLAARFVGEGRSVMLAAADTYRAAASEQLAIWADRAGAEIVSHQPGADPGAVVYDALQAARARGHDVVIVDTAGRLQTRKPLMQQLAKIRRVIDKVVPGGPHETLLVIDGTMGQNALSQARLFDEATPLTGVAVAKLDGTAKGGMILTITSEMKLPVKLIGIGEKLDDLKDFDADAFVEVLA